LGLESCSDSTVDLVRESKPERDTKGRGIYGEIEGNWNEDCAGVKLAVISQTYPPSGRNAESKVVRKLERNLEIRISQKAKILH
jgi:hypothetical protein